MTDAGRRRFDAVVVWRFDRFARSVSHLLRALEQFQALGIDFVSLSENVETSTPTGKMVFTVLGAVAELERSLIQERVKAGLRNARAKGKRLGRPRADVDETEIIALRAAGVSWRAVAEKLGVGVGTVHRIAQQTFQKRLLGVFERWSGGALCLSASRNSRFSIAVSNKYQSSRTTCETQ